MKKATRKPRPLRTFAFPVLDLIDNPIPGCEVRYNREDGYSAYCNGNLIGYADSKLEAEQMSRDSVRGTRKAA